MLSRFTPEGARKALTRASGLNSIRKRLMASQEKKAEDQGPLATNSDKLDNQPRGLPALIPISDQNAERIEKLPLQAKGSLEENFELGTLPESNPLDLLAKDFDDEKDDNVPDKWMGNNESDKDLDDGDDEAIDINDDDEDFDVLEGYDYDEDLSISDEEETASGDENEQPSSDESIQFITQVKSTRNISVKVEEEDDDDALLSQALDDVEGKVVEENKADAEECNTEFVPTSFSILLSREEWQQIIRPVTINVDGDSYQWYEHCKRVYGDSLQKGFSKKNKCCVLFFSKACVRQPHEESRAFWRCYGACTGEKCKARYAFTVRHVTPPGSDNVMVNVRKTSQDELKHFTTDKLHRQLKGEKREEIKKKLLTQKLFRVFTDECAKADPEQLRFGNINVVKTLKVYQQCGVEVRKYGDYHEDIIVDLALTHIRQKQEWQGAKMSGFLQNLSLFPFWMTFLCEGQLKLLRKMSRSEKVTLYFDSTGKICEPLPEPLDQTMIQYYGLVIKCPKSKEAPIPLLEFYSNRHDMSAISFQLTFFLERYKDAFPSIKGRNYGIRRVETDFAKAMIASCCKCFQNGFVDDYLTILHNSLLEKTAVDEDLVAIHVCSFHVDKFLKERLDTVFKAEHAKASAQATKKGKKKVELSAAVQDKERLLRSWGRNFVVASSYDDVVHRMKEIIILTGFSYFTNEVEIIVKTFGGKPDLAYNYRRFKIQRIKGGPFYKRTPFGQIAQQIFSEVEAENKRLRTQQMEGRLKLAENEYADSGFLSYLLVHVLPYAPILTHCVFVAHDIAIDGDTNNNVELWMKILKRNYFQEVDWGHNGIRAPRLARAHATMIKGLLAKAITGDGFDLPGSDDESPQKDEQESPEKQLSTWGPKKQSQPVKQNLSTNLQGMPLISLGGKFYFRKQEITLDNTCNIDCTLQIVFYIFRYTDKGRKFFQEKTDKLGNTMKQFFALMEANKVQIARLTWVRLVLGMKGCDLKLFGAEREQGVGGMREWFRYILKTVKCSQDRCPSHERDPVVSSAVDEHPISPDQFMSWFQGGKTSTCNVCHSNSVEVFKFNGNAPALIVYICDSRWVTNDGVTVYAPENRLQKVQSIGGITYTVVAYTVYMGNHFCAVIWDNNCRYTYDGSEVPLRILPRQEVTSFPIHTVWLLRD